jgi:hypothetical protein
MKRRFTLCLLPLVFLAGFALCFVLSSFGFHCVSYFEKAPNATVLPKHDRNRLIASANDAQLTLAHRAHAVFALFAQYLRLPATKQDIEATLDSREWIRDAVIIPMSLAGGKNALDAEDNSTMFYMKLFGRSNPASPWSIEFNLRGGETLTATDAISFLKGGGDEQTNLELSAFALIWPHPYLDGHLGRIEAYSRWRITVTPEHE